MSIRRGFKDNDLSLFLSVEQNQLGNIEIFGFEKNKRFPRKMNIAVNEYIICEINVDYFSQCIATDLINIISNA